LRARLVGCLPEILLDPATLNEAHFRVKVLPNAFVDENRTKEIVFVERGGAARKKTGMYARRRRAHQKTAHAPVIGHVQVEVNTRAAIVCSCRATLTPALTIDEHRAD